MSGREDDMLILGADGLPDGVVSPAVLAAEADVLACQLAVCERQAAATFTGAVRERLGATVGSVVLELTALALVGHLRTAQLALAGAAPDLDVPAIWAQLHADAVARLDALGGGER